MAPRIRLSTRDTALWLMVLANTVASCWLVAVRLPQAPAVEATRDIRSRAAEAVGGATVAERSKVYGLFQGLADYLDAGHPGCDNTPQLLEMWSRALTISGWERETLPSLTDLVESELKSRGFSDPQPLAPRAPELVEVFREVAGGVKEAGT